MQSFELSIYIQAPIEKVFDIISNHEGYSQFPMMESAKLIRQGNTEKNGTGAIREVYSFPNILFLEEIVLFNRPNLMAYKIIKTTLPVKHDISLIRLEDYGIGTRVYWYAQFTSEFPIFGPLIAWTLRFIVKDAFQRILKCMKRQLEAKNP